MSTSAPYAAMALLLLGTGWGASRGVAQEDSAATRVVVLHSTPGPALRIDFDYNFRRAVPPFENEPASQGKKIARGLIPTVPPTPFVRNVADNVLYLKVDHGRDFSEGSLATCQGRYDGHVCFEGLTVSTERESLVVPYIVNLYTHEAGCAGWFLVVSGWAGEFEMDGQTWMLGVVDNLNGRIDSNDLLYLQGPGKLMPVFPVADTLFFGGHTFHLSLTFESINAEVVVKATLTELHPQMGELNIEADGSRHVRLRSEHLTVLLDDPPGTVALPVGNYRVEDCVLYDEHLGWAGPKFVACSRDVPVQPGPAASLRLGKPLSNTVEIARDRNLLLLDYRLVGAGGEQYSYYNWRSSPSFTVSKGPLRIAAGTFPFGASWGEPYSWRVPFYGFGSLTVLAQQDIGALGPAQGPAVTVHCPIKESLRRVFLWFVLLALLLRKPNRNRQAWSLAIVLAVVSLLLHVADSYINSHIIFYLHRHICTIICESLQALAAALAVLLAMSDLISLRHPLLRFLLIFLALFETGAVAIFVNASAVLSTGLWITAFGLFLLVFLIGHAVLQALLRRLVRRPLGWSTAISFFLGAGPVLAFALVDSTLNRSPQFQNTAEYFRLAITLSEAILGAYFVFFWFLSLALLVPLYRERLARCFGYPMRT